MGSNKHPYFFFYDEGSTYRYGWGFKLWKVHIVNQSSFSPKYHLQVSFLCWKLSLRHVQCFYKIFTVISISIFRFQLCPLSSLSAIFPGKNREWEDGSFWNPNCFSFRKGICVSMLTSYSMLITNETWKIWWPGIVLYELRL